MQRTVMMLACALVVACCGCGPDTTPKVGSHTVLHGINLPTGKRDSQAILCKDEHDTTEMYLALNKNPATTETTEGMEASGRAVEVPANTISVAVLRTGGDAGACQVRIVDASADRVQGALLRPGSTWWTFEECIQKP